MIWIATNGCFDPVCGHHIMFLEQARVMGDHLVVYVASDEVVRVLKGCHRPLLPLVERCKIIGALRCVDSVQSYKSEEELDSFYKKHIPDFRVKGSEYKGEKTSRPWIKTVYTNPILGHATDYLNDYVQRAYDVSERGKL